MNKESFDRIKEAVDQMDKKLSRRELIAGTAGFIGGAALMATASKFSGDTEPQNGEKERRFRIVRGIDISYPQQSAAQYESMRHDFVIIGVNEGIPTMENPYLVDQLKVARIITHDANPEVTGIAPIQLYINTANPADFIDVIETWPSAPDQEIDGNPYATTADCSGTDSQACMYTYGWQRARASMEMFLGAAEKAGISNELADYTVWLDVEEYNSWQENQENNRVVLEGKVAFLQSKGAKVGIYSTRSHWDSLIGDTVDKNSNLYDLPSWVAKGVMSEEDTLKSLSEDKEQSFTPGGRVAMVQRVEGKGAEDPNALDYNYAIIPE